MKKDIPVLVEYIFMCPKCLHRLVSAYSQARRGTLDVYCDCGQVYRLSCLEPPAVDDITAKVRK